MIVVGVLARLMDEVSRSRSADPPPICYGGVDSDREHAQRGSVESLFRERTNRVDFVVKDFISLFR